jgi:hypothetical protein
MELTDYAAVPDPYPIDDDLELLDDEYPTPTSRPEPSRRKSKRDSAQPAEPLTAPPSADDPVVADRSIEVEPAPVEAERPRHREQRERERPRRERGNSDAMGTLAGVAGTAAAVSGFKNMFGLGRKKTAAPDDERRERRRTAYETEDERRHRKRSTTRGGMTEDEAKRLRHERRSVRKSTRVPDAEAEPMMTGANGSGEYDPEREARRAARRARHEQDKEARRAELEEVEAKNERRRERARETERDALADKKARQMAELERRNKLAEEELRRMAEKDEKRKSRKLAEDGAREHRSSRRKEKESRETSRPHNERRRSHVDDDAERRRRHEERRAARRNSDYPVQPSGEPIADYFDERNGTAHRPATTKRSSRRTQDEEQNMPYINKGPDKTSSWVQSLSEEPPLPPPISETVLDPAPGAREAPDDEETPSQDEDIRLRIAGRRGGKRDKAERERERARDEKERKHHRRKSQFDGPRGSVEEADKRKERRKTYANPAYEEQPIRTWDGRPALDGNGGAGKRGSWFKKIF